MAPKNRILDTAEEQFLRFGIRAISMDDIASHLAMSKKTIYKYYKDKKALVKEVTKKLIEHAQGECICSCERSSSAVDELLLLIGFINSFFSNMNPSVMLDLEKSYPESYSVFREHQEGFLHDSIVANLQRGKKEGLYRKDLDLEIMARIRMGQVKLAFDQSLFPASEFDLKEVQLALLDLYLMGITTDKGRKIINDYKEKNG